jgi:hypothetical protein
MYSTENSSSSELVGGDRCYSFDFETFVKPHQQILNVYAWGLYNSNLGYVMDYGEDCFENFINFILEIPAIEGIRYKKGKDGKITPETYNKPQYAIAYNGSRFDFHFVIDELSRRNVEIENLIINNGAILGFSIKHNNLKFWDINQHIAGPLKKALKDFKCDTQKGDFDHFKIKSWTDVHQYKDEWEPYLEGDVLGLSQLVEKYSNTVYHIFDEVEGLEASKFDPKEFLTLPSCGFKMWQHTLFNDKKRDQSETTPLIEIPNKQEDIKNIRQATYGGRTYPLVSKYESKHYAEIKKLWKEQEEAKTEAEKKELLEKGKKIYDNLDDYIFNADVTSLYPTAMRYYEYPNGQGRRLDDEEKKEDLKSKLNNGQPLPYHCILRVKMTNSNQNLIVAPLPKPKMENKRRVGVSWDIKDVNDGWYTHIDIEHAVKHGYKVEEIYDGILYEDGSAKLFSKYVDTFLKIKQNQDSLKGTPEYNPALRAVAKLFVNSLYGKTLQKPVYNNTKLCKSAKDIIEFWNTHTVSECLIGETGDTVILTGTILDLEKGNTKPNHLGAFLLSYSRRIMLEAIEAINPELDEHSFTYTDTDSLHIHAKDLHKLKFDYWKGEDGNHYMGDKINRINGKKWFDKGLGCLSNDIDDEGLIVKELNYGPKNYYYVYITENGEIKSTRKSKGIVKDYLTDDLYENGESKQIVMKKRLKKIGIKPNKNQSNCGLTSFNIIQTDMTRSWNPDWQLDRVIDGKYYPEGHIKLTQ